MSRWERLKSWNTVQSAILAILGSTESEYSDDIVTHGLKVFSHVWKQKCDRKSNTNADQSRHMSNWTVVFCLPTHLCAPDAFSLLMIQI